MEIERVDHMDSSLTNVTRDQEPVTGLTKHTVDREQHQIKLLEQKRVAVHQVLQLHLSLEMQAKVSNITLVFLPEESVEAKNIWVSPLNQTQIRVNSFLVEKLVLHNEPKTSDCQLVVV